MPSSRPLKSASTRIERLPFHQSSATRPDSPGPSAAARFSSTAAKCDFCARAARCMTSGTACSKYHAKMSPTADCPASYPQRPGTTPSSTVPHIPSTICRSVASSKWQIEVPMIITIDPGSVTVHAGTATWASTLPIETGVPAARPLFLAHVFHCRVKGAKEIARGESPALHPHRLVSRRAGVALLLARELPDNPVGRFDEALGGGVDFRRFVQNLEQL